jgi:hypothetical protein
VGVLVTGAARLRLMRELLRPVARSLPWTVLAGGGGLGLALPIMAWLIWADMGPGEMLTLLRLAALCGAMAAACALDDPARPTTGVVPVPRAARQGLRLCLVLVAAAGWWGSVLGVAALLGPDGLPAGAVTLEAAGLFALAFLLASGAVRFSAAAVPGPFAAGALLALFVAAFALLPDDVTPFVPLGDDDWGRAHQLWALLLAGAAAAWAGCAREPAR